MKDHPRRCGEHANTDEQNGKQNGSSPQMRGAPPVASADARQERIIPADAGSTWRRGEAPVRSRDHPRRCGEHDGLIAFGRGCGGSFPQMRGARVWPSPSATRTGIIPADAGSTTPCGGWAWWTTDHPRRCGEHYTSPGTHWDECGSSPRMRGAPHNQDHR